MDRELIATKTFTAELVKDTTYSRSTLGMHESTMELYDYGDNELGIEWDVPALETGESIGIRIEDKKAVEFWGIMGMPSEAIELLEANGYNCREIKEDYEGD